MRFRLCVESSYEQLPDELQVNIFSYLSNGQEDQSGLVRTSSRFYNLFQPQRLVDKLLALAADAEQAAVDKLMKLLAINPSVLLEKGNVVNRGGNTIEGVTPYEFALGEGDPELAAKIAHYFDKIPGGEAEREQQYDQYKPHIDAMPTQAPYDLTSLFNIIKKSSPEDVTAALNKEFNLDSVLNQALKQFRANHSPRIIKNPCMHYNHKTLEQAFTLLYDEWKALSANDTNYDKCLLVYRQIIGYLQLTLPGIDRIAFARAFQGQERTLEFIWADGRFPDSRACVACSELGFDELIFGCARSFAAGLRTGCAAELYKIHVEQKPQTYRTYAVASGSNDRMGHLLR